MDQTQHSLLNLAAQEDYSKKTTKNSEKSAVASKLKGKVPLFRNDKDHIALLTAIYTKKKKAILIFCASKAGCSSLATKLSFQLPQ
jgi:superfamily II DNA/RNA helicase